MIIKQSKIIALGVAAIVFSIPTNVMAKETIKITDLSSVSINDTINATRNNDDIKIGWKQNEDNSYIILDGKGSIVKSSWCKVGGKWYYFNDDGVMQTGWIKNEDNWYHLNKDGIEDFGWIKDKGDWYYLDESGVMKIGWLYIDKYWYYFNDSGIMQHNTSINGYKLGTDGVCQ